MKNLRNEKGITLVALVVTIIVLLILAGVSLSLVAGGNGIIDKASNSVTATSEGSAKEQTELKFAELAADYYEAKYVRSGGTTATSVLEYINDEITTKGNNKTGDGNYTITLSSSSLTVTGSGVTVSGTVASNGNITWAK